MGNFNRNDRDRRSRDREKGRDSFSRDRDQRRTEMHQAICADCGKRCEVPFKPTNQRPVYCSDCFSRQGGSDRRDDKSSYGGGKFQEKRGSDFESKSINVFKAGDTSKEQLDKVITKLDTIINLLSSKQAPKEIEPDLADTKAIKEAKKVVKKDILKKLLGSKDKPVTKKK
ncbi:MAG: hypothetical protein KY054_03075 [Candidatus Nealsonbacteria bacterium]|nr:hypothetical protein [Candidatus Nealsonbacteria bacterium]